ncbi:MAG: Asp-tRNA(Asn)/Glu-tRNA(Gln) amidotransferase subunit GatB [Candidatus Micrarchaeia archaeon]
MPEEELLIGLEIHVQLKSEAKLFCPCRASYQGVEANTNICPICTGQPGAKPMSVNERALRNLLKIALALGARVLVDEPIHIQRKHYFYPDLPSGYQRTSKPIAVEGRLGEVRIRELHLEEDPGRYELKKGLVDYNRSGIPLVEIVTEPDIRSPEAARAFLEELAAILGYLDAAREEAGSTRIDANISLAGGSRVEVKNINSFKGVFTALSYEILRQKALLSKGMAVARETRHYDEAQGITIGLRRKEAAEDYRYFPDPDIPPLIIPQQLVASLSLPELPRQRSARIAQEYRIRGEDAWVIVAERELADVFESLAKKFPPQELAFWMRGPLKKQLNWRNLTFRDSGLSEKQVSELLELLFSKKITEKVAEELLIKLIEKKISSAKTEVEAAGLARIDSEREIAKIVEEVLAEHPKAVRDYKAGEARALNFLAGKVMAKTRGKADPAIVSRLLKEKLG